MSNTESYRQPNRLDLMSPAEKKISEAIYEVEKIGADVLLTDAVILLGKARDKTYEYLRQNNIETNNDDLAYRQMLEREKAVVDKLKSKGLSASQPAAKEATQEEAIEILTELCKLKHYKDTVGKDEIYEKKQPELWKLANEFLTKFSNNQSK